MSGATDELLALLNAAEASLRATIAEALPPAAVLRIERASTREARRLVADRAVARDVDLPIGWAEFVEIDAAIDALLERLPPIQVVERRVAKPRRPPEPIEVAVQVAVEVDGDITERRERKSTPVESWVVGLPAASDEPASAPVEVIAPPEPKRAAPTEPKRAAPPEPKRAAPARPVAEPAPVAAKPAPAVAAKAPLAVEHVAPVSVTIVPTSDTIVPASESDADEPTIVEPVDEDLGEAAELNEREQRWADAQWVSYEEQPAYDEDDDEAYFEGGAEPAEEVQYIVYTDPALGVLEDAKVDDEPLPAWAADAKPVEEEPRQKPAGRKKEPEAKPVPAPAPVVEPEPADDEWAYAGPGEVRPAVPAKDAYALLRKERMRLDDFSQVERPVAPDDEPTSVHTIRGGRSGPAAIQLSADGSSRVLGEDDDEDSNVIELGDTRDYGDEDAVDDDQTGILGIGVVEYDDDVEEIDELEDYESGLEDLPGAPELTPAEISALFAKAEEAGRRNMADGVLLFSDVLDADPHRSDALLARGRLYLDLGDFPGAISDFLKAEALHPRDPDAQVALGDLFQGRKDYGKAVSYYTRALSIDADHAPALARRGMAHYFRRQHSAAEEDLERAKKLDPSLPLVDTYLARLRKK